MLLGFYPQITIDHDWTSLLKTVNHVAEHWVRSGKLQEHLLYQQAASQVASLPGGGWISKSGPSEDFFVFGGVDATESIGRRFQERFPSLTFTPATMGCTSGHVPIHRDHSKNGQTSLVYPLHDNPSLGRVFDPAGQKDFYYLCQKDQMVAINITERHTVYVHEPRVWFTIHCQEPLEQVKQVFDSVGPIVL